MTSNINARVEDYMTRSYHTIDRDATVHDAIALLNEHNLNALIVDRLDQDDEVGLLTVSDIAREVMGKHRPPKRTYVFEVMSKPVVSIPPRMRVVYATRLLASLDLSQAVVTDENRNPVGLVNRRDLVFACLED